MRYCILPGSILDEYPGPIMVDLIIKNRVMVDMICEEFTCPRDSTTGDAMQFSMTFVKVRFANVNLATITYTSNLIGGEGTSDTIAAAQAQQKQQVQVPKADIGANYENWSNGKMSTLQFLYSIVGQ